MNQISSYLSRFHAYLKSHKWARIACIVLLVFLALSIVLHPYGSKTFLILGMDNYGSLDTSGRSDVIMLVQVDFTRTRLSAISRRSRSMPDISWLL